MAKWLRDTERDLHPNHGQAHDPMPVSWIKVRRHGPTTHIRAKLLLGGSVAAQITITSTGDARRVRRILRTLAKAIPRVSSRLCLEWLRREANIYERRRLSEDLHDGPLQIATAAKIWLQVRRRTVHESEAANLDEAIEMMGRVIASMRELMRGRVQGVRAHSLETQLRRAARRWAQITGVRVMFSFPEEGLDDKLLLSQDTVKAVEHLVGEGIVNAWKHGKATHLWVSCRPKDGGLELTLKDDGQGLPQPTGRETPDGMKLGLRLLQSRITELGGRLDVRSPQTGGTVIETWLPQRLAIS